MIRNIWLDSQLFQLLSLPARCISDGTHQTLNSFPELESAAEVFRASSVAALMETKKSLRAGNLHHDQPITQEHSQLLLQGCTC
uniref:Uncharacterized protein n=1 Tax=Gorilla gorilla gorilla TaxID=9595 RepID=G3SK85_GORGO